MTRRLLIAVASGAVLGLTWWFAYVPSAHPLGALLALHIGAALGLSALLARRPLRQAVPALWLGLGLGLGAAPAWLYPLHEAGLLGGMRGAVVDGLAVLIGAGAGVILGAGLGQGGRRAWASAAGALVLLGALAGTARRVEMPDAARPQPKAATVAADFPARKVAVIGIDGADWSVIQPMIAAGELPNLARLVATGRHGVLRSLVPTYSPVVWATIFSGEPPEVHGLVDWYSADARSRRVPMLWDLFGAHGRSSLTINVPGSWPPATVDRGWMLSGFPIPGLSTGAKGQLLGMVASSAREHGPVPTVALKALGDGTYALDAPLAAYDIAPRIPGLRNQLLDTAVRKSLLALAGYRLRLTATQRDGQVTLTGPSLRSPVTLDPDAWSGWVRAHDGDLEVVLRVRQLPADAGQLRLYLGPAYQTPWAPRYPFATGDFGPRFFESGEPYIVEGVGWTAHSDDRVAALVPAQIADVEEGHVAAAERLLMREDIDLLSIVLTAVDRVSHPFWPLHDPTGYPSPPRVPTGMAGEDPVAEAYRDADTALGRLLLRLPEDALVLVVSDHGFTAHTDQEEGEHRLDGVWIAAGPMIPAADAPLTLQVADVVPTLLRCLGAPVALDMSGQAHGEICPDMPALPPVPSYRRPEDAATVGAATINQSQQDQLKAMGYLDEEGHQTPQGEETTP